VGATPPKRKGGASANHCKMPATISQVSASSVTNAKIHRRRHFSRKKQRNMGWEWIGMENVSTIWRRKLHRPDIIVSGHAQNPYPSIPRHCFCVTIGPIYYSLG